jgi:indolepyruvate ferredoxin oxidoreductase beta subunit
VPLCLFERRHREEERVVKAPHAMQLLVVGVGGQGVLTAAQVLAAAAHDAGHPATVGQLHGMSQRGGSVECTVRFGDVHTSQLIGQYADVVLGFELLETLRAGERIGPNTVVVTSTSRIVPSTVTLGNAPYPSSEEIIEQLTARALSVRTVDGPELSRRAGQSRSLNAVLLGALAGVAALPFSADSLLCALDERCAARFSQANRRAFELGLAETRSSPKEEAVSP